MRRKKLVNSPLKALGFTNSEVGISDQNDYDQIEKKCPCKYGHCSYTHQTINQNKSTVTSTVKFGLSNLLKTEAEPTRFFLYSFLSKYSNSL